MSGPRATLLDTRGRYGLVSRVLHGVTAFLVLWQFAMVAFYKIFGESPFLNSVARFGPHGYVGFALLFLALARSFWALGGRSRRPELEAGVRGRLAKAMHAVLLGLLVTIPSLALARLCGKGEGWTIGGVEVIPATGRVEPISVAVADAAHGPLSWLLLALVGGHAAMALLHGFVWKDGSLARMFPGVGFRRA
jgi:cytochrome b561